MFAPSTMGGSSEPPRTPPVYGPVTCIVIGFPSYNSTFLFESYACAYGHLVSFICCSHASVLINVPLPVLYSCTMYNISCYMHIWVLDIHFLFVNCLIILFCYLVIIPFVDFLIACCPWNAGVVAG